MRLRFTLLLTSLLLLFSNRGESCTNLMVTPGASADGSAMVTYAADSHVRYGTLAFRPAANYPKGSLVDIYQWGQERYLGQIEQVAHTYSVIGNMNEHQVAIGESTWGGEKGQVDPNGILDYGSLMYLALQRAKTAREAIDVIVSLADKYGYASTGESLSIADPNEVWFMEMIGRAPKIVNGENVNKGIVWVAIKLPDGTISAHANQARITTFPLNDPENCIYSPDVISHAKEQGLYKGRDKNFSFADAYGAATNQKTRACDSRVWAFFNKWAEDDMSRYIPYIIGDITQERPPLYVKPKKSLTVKDLAEMMRDWFGGTPLDMLTDIGAGGNDLPYRWRPMRFEVDGETFVNERAIVTQQTGFWFVAQSRANFPNEIGGILWFAVDDAGTSPLTPFYSSSTRISHHYAEGNGSMVEYSPTSMFWLTNRIANFAYLRYNQIGAEVKQKVDEHEYAMLAEVEEIDRIALAMYKNYPELVSKFLTDYSVNSADKLFEKWDKLDKYLLIKYIDGNIKVQNEDGSFKTNGHSDRIPVAPTFGGYSERWKRAVKEDAGEKLRMP